MSCDRLPHLRACRSFLLTLLMAASVQLFVGPLHAQQGEPIKEADFQLSFIRPEHAELRILYDLINKIYGRQVQFPDGRMTPNLMLGNGAILVHETAARLKVIKDAVAQLDVPGPEARQNDDVVTLPYEPRAQRASSLQRALQVFALPSSRGRIGLTVRMHERGILMLQGAPAVIEKAKELLARIDRPAPQIMLSAYVLVGCDERGPRAPIAELEEALREVLPYRHYRVHAASVVRVAAEANRQFSIELQGADQGERRNYGLNGTIGAFDPERVALTLDKLSVHVRPNMGRAVRSLIETSTTVFGGEYAVLGVAGGEPVFIVIRLKAIGDGGSGRSNGGPRGGSDVGPGGGSGGRPGRKAN